VRLAGIRYADSLVRRTGVRIRLGFATRGITNGCSDMAKARVLREFWQFLKQEKKYWLAPIVLVLLLFGLLLVFAQSSAVAPFIYTLF